MVVIACKDKVVFDTDEEECKVGTKTFVSSKGIIDFEDEAVEFEVDFSSNKN